MSDHDPDEFQRVMKWPIREGLLTYVEHLKSKAEEGYRLQLLAHSLFGGKAPKPPDILES